MLVERSDAAQADPAALKAARSKIERALAALDRKGVKFRTTTDEWMRLLRGRRLTLVDTNIFIDLLTRNADRFEASQQALERRMSLGPILIVECRLCGTGDRL